MLVDDTPKEVTEKQARQHVIDVRACPASAPITDCPRCAKADELDLWRTT